MKPFCLLLYLDYLWIPCLRYFHWDSYLFSPESLWLWPWCTVWASRLSYYAPLYIIRLLASSKSFEESTFLLWACINKTIAWKNFNPLLASLKVSTVSVMLLCGSYASRISLMVLCDLSQRCLVRIIRHEWLILLATHLVA